MEFDFIIIGAGSAGCVLADRLSADGRHSVLLLEAGGSDARFWIKVPLGYGFTFSDPGVNWAYSAAPDAGLNGRIAYWPRGRVLGGSSSINAMAYVRGLAHDFDDWAQSGASGWDWNSVRQTYDRLETHAETGPDGQPRLRGNGPVRVSDLRAQMHPFSDRFLKGARDLGLPVTDDLNGPQNEGLTYLRSTVRDGRRWSAADAFLRPALRRPNLRLMTQAQVTRIALEDGRATAVHLVQHGQPIMARARAEILLSAGAINSPQILQLSGIGPGAVMQEMGLAVHHALPQVGQGLQDHLALTHHYAARVPTLNATLGNPVGQVLAGIRYVLTRRGPLAVPVNQVGGFLRSAPDRAAPDMQVYCNPATYTTAPGGRPRVDRTPGFILSVQPCRPSSRGSVTLATPDPFQPPRIQPNSLSTEGDRDQAVRAGRLLQHLAQAPAIANVTALRKAPDIVGQSDPELLQTFRERASTVFHASCTCRMGRDATQSVVDARLRVHGLRGLRVVDASAFPNITSGNTNAPTLMLALRAADLILQDAAGG